MPMIFRKSFDSRRESQREIRRGAALLIILAVSAIIIPLMYGAWMDSQVSYQFNRYRMNELRARYSAQSGLALSLLRVYVFKGIEESVPETWRAQARPLLDKVWTFPLAWPFAPDPDFLESDKQDINKIKSQSFLKGSYISSIAPEDGRLDINDLSSPLPYLREFVYSSLLNLLSSAVQKDKKLRDKYDTGDLEEILNNLSDWTDLDNNSQNGGSEELLEEGKKPLNRSFASVEEIRKTPRMEEEIFEILHPHITVYGTKALNINYASEEILRALGFSEDLAEQIMSRTALRSDHYSPFLSHKDFCDFVNERGLPFCEGLKEQWETLDMLSFGFPMAFRIKSRGEHKGQMVNLEALLYDMSSSLLLYQKFHHAEEQRRKARDGTEEQSDRERRENGEKQRTERDKKADPAKIHYFYYRSLIIMYLKESF